MLSGQQLRWQNNKADSGAGKLRKNKLVESAVPTTVSDAAEGRQQLGKAQELLTDFNLLRLSLHRTLSSKPTKIKSFPQDVVYWTLSSQVHGINSSLSRKREQRVLFMVAIMVICYLLCWLPYGIMALMATFGSPGLVTPVASIIPSLLAKTSTFINPVIYVFMNKQLLNKNKAELAPLWRARETGDRMKARRQSGLGRFNRPRRKEAAPRRGSSIKSSSKVATKVMRAAVTGTRRNNFLLLVASLGQPTPTLPRPDPSVEVTIDNTKGPSSDINKPVVSLVAEKVSEGCGYWQRDSRSQSSFTCQRDTVPLCVPTRPWRGHVSR
ncbi:hypothetical protein FQN60_016278 [Etheostoma spectabile]|uniref:G-protein coupled receptors family 1 profile domain-containing protein n=1 Tax=Etheostoma spectabile TaxID=54343 RepID=A0A5J5D400_9PERO|nr:hypothetical protein FQN60_016278 [Etheostoma spectabile]